MNTSQILEQQELVIPQKKEGTRWRDKVRQWLAPPVFEGDEEKTRTARLLNVVLLSLGVASLALVAFVVIVFTVEGVSMTVEDAFIPVSCVVMVGLIIGLRALARRGYQQLASTVILAVLFLVNTVWMYGFAGTAGGDSALIYAILVVLGPLLLGRYGMIITVLTIASILGAYFAENAGVISAPGQPPLNMFDLIFVLLPMGLIGLLLAFAVNSLSRALGLAHSSKEALAERTRELEASQRVTFAASERSDPDELLNLVVNLIRDQFDLYHVQVYTVDETINAAVLRKSTGYAGRQLLQQKHHIPLDRSALVTRAIREGKAVLVPDVHQSPDFMPNPLLPETRSELAVPLKVGGRVTGVLDVQDHTPGRFNAETAALFQTMADQVAFLFENSELLDRVTEQAQELTAFTNQLRTAADIAQRLGTILTPDRLLQQVADLMQSRFGFYHVHIYILDKDSQRLTVQAGSGEIGQVLRERGHAIRLSTKRSLVARAAREKSTLLVNNTSLEPDFMPNPLLPQTSSEVAVPLMIGENVLGVLDVQDDQIDRFSPADLDTFNTLAGQIATSLQNANLFEQVENNLAATQARLWVSQALATPQTENQILDAMVEVAGSYPDSSFYIHLLDPGATEPTLVAARSAPLKSGMPALAEAGTSSLVREFLLSPQPNSEQTFFSPNLPADERISPTGRALAEQMGVASIAVLPITAGTEWLGIIVAASRKPAFFDNPKRYIYQSLAEQAAIALRTARLRAERERFTAQLRTAADLAEQINTILDPDRLLKEVVEQLRDRFGLYHVHVYLLEQPMEDTLKNADYAEISRLMLERELVMKAGSGKVGQALLERSHSIRIDKEKSLVARAARTRQVISVGDTGKEPDFMPNPLLPETRCEIAIPLYIGDNVLGVLDVQDSSPNRFTQSDLDVFSTLAGQIATALQNASLFEEVQKTTERLREVDRLKSEFLANMSHELRTPLNSIIGYTEIMLMGIDSQLDPESLEDVQAIYDNGQHLLRLINDVLDLAKIEAGRLELVFEDLEVGSLVEEACSGTAGLLVNKPIELAIEVDKDLPALQGDRVRLNQILYNLLSNAAKFTDEGQIAVRAYVDHDSRQDKAWMCLEVTDTGTGISKQDIEEIFERFQQVDGSNSRKAEGTGLGLAITRHLVQMHGGTIGVQSQLGEGSTFIVRLPLQHSRTLTASAV
jgi:signal transduction histidine kinase